MQKYILIALILVGALSCQEAEKELPILGNKTEKDGEMIYHTIPDFSFVNQDSQVVNNATFDNKAYVVDFFFISCPTICPKVKKQMLRIYDVYKDNENLSLLSHTVDTKRDTVGRLKKYSSNIGVSAPAWHFVTGDKDEIYEIADDYFSIVKEVTEENDGAEAVKLTGGFDHSGRLILVDKNRHIRAFCDGTDEKDVTEFMKDIEILLAENKE